MGGSYKFFYTKGKISVEFVCSPFSFLFVSFNRISNQKWYRCLSGCQSHRIPLFLNKE